MGAIFRLLAAEKRTICCLCQKSECNSPGSASFHLLRVVLKYPTLFSKGCALSVSMRPHNKNSSVIKCNMMSWWNLHFLGGISSPDAFGIWTGTHKNTLRISYLLCHPVISSSIVWNDFFFSFCAGIVSVIRHQVKWLRQWYCSRLGYQSTLWQVGLFHVTVKSRRCGNNATGGAPIFCL